MSHVIFIVTISSVDHRNLRLHSSSICSVSICVLVCVAACPAIIYIITIKPSCWKYILIFVCLPATTGEKAEEEEI